MGYWDDEDIWTDEHWEASSKFGFLYNVALSVLVVLATIFCLMFMGVFH